MLPNLEALHLYNYEPFTVLGALSRAGEVSTLDGVRQELKTLRKRVQKARKDGDRMKEAYDKARQDVRNQLRLYSTLTSISPYLHHEHEQGQTTQINVLLNGKPAVARITYGCQWEHGNDGDHELFLETSIVLQVALEDPRMTLTAKEDIGRMKPWWQNLESCCGPWIRVPLMLEGPHDPSWFL